VFIPCRAEGVDLTCFVSGCFEPSLPDVLGAALRVVAGMGRSLACGGTTGFFPRPFSLSVVVFEPPPPDVFHAAALRVADGGIRSLACGGTLGLSSRPSHHSVGAFEPCPPDILGATLRLADGVDRSLARGGTPWFLSNFSHHSIGGFGGLDSRGLGLPVLAAWAAAANQYGSTLMEVDAELFALGFEESLLAEMAI